MDDNRIRFSISFAGEFADRRLIDFYDVSQALVGFERSLALTTHLILNNEIITQAPSLKGARFLATPPEPGSWKFTTTVMFTGTAIYSVLTAPSDTVLGHLVSSAYDYVISESLGFHVDYNKTLGLQYEEFKAAHPDLSAVPVPSESKLDSLIEKCEAAIQQMHRPIVKSETASEAALAVTIEKQSRPLGSHLTHETYEHLLQTIQSESASEFSGRVSSYNMNTFKGRIYLTDAHRPIPFILSERARSKGTIGKITRSLVLNAENASGNEGTIRFLAHIYQGRTGRLKSLLIVRVPRAIAWVLEIVCGRAEQDCARSKC